MKLNSNIFISIITTAILVFMAIKVIRDDPTNFPSIAIGGLLLLMAGNIIAGLIVTEFLRSTQKNNIKNPYIVGCSVSGLMGLVTLITVLSKVDSLETYIGACVYSPIVIIISLFSGMLISRRLSLMENQKNNK